GTTAGTPTTCTMPPTARYRSCATSASLKGDRAGGGLTRACPLCFLNAHRHCRSTALSTSCDVANAEGRSDTCRDSIVGWSLLTADGPACALILQPYTLLVPSLSSPGRADMKPSVLPHLLAAILVL